jgi:isocitrate dehydrogenase
MFDYLGWPEVKEKIEAGLESAIRDRVVTYDLARQMEGATEVKCSEFADAIIERL